MVTGSLLDRFAAAVAAVPDGVAVEYRDERVSYRELDRRSALLAGRLSDLGVGAEDVVGVAVTRSVEWVVAVLGTVRAGAAWLPLDPEYPGERLRYTLADAGARVVIDDGSADLAGAGVARIAPDRT